jgi:thioredoxin-like negative regulator of GroEL
MQIHNKGPILDGSKEKLSLVYFGTIVESTPKAEMFFDGMYANFSEDFLFHVVDVESYPELANKCQVYDFPKILIFSQGKEIDRLNAPFSPKELLPHVINALARMKN